ncbi:hypothetical protein [Daejeonella lutea]|uniref:Uncharacterized protein n=1 Tax=Daejeonella lutea TaxID=572036 RepID=A0A1T5ECW5_9SPHI|nr:hypothetical protein [Daejeonella lutea]SKB81957.1 hypothetical protein SAMN05661099_2909 [Daejeonella lutea]
MSDTNKNPGKDQKQPSQTEQQNDKLDIGNDMSLGHASGAGVSDFDPDRDSPETEEKEYREDSGNGDDERSGDNGINPSPDEVNPQSKAASNEHKIENADEDKLNPYPDELKPDSDDEHFNSTWMMSGRNKQI